MNKTIVYILCIISILNIYSRSESEMEKYQVISNSFAVYESFDDGLKILSNYMDQWGTDEFGYMYGKFLWGLADADNHILLDCIYDYICRTPEGLIVTILNKNYSYYSYDNGDLLSVDIFQMDINKEDYFPFEGRKVAKTNLETKLNWIRGEKIPRLDGAIFLLPLYAAIAEAVYPEQIRYDTDMIDANTIFVCTDTTRAIKRLINNEVDLVFCTDFTDDQLDLVNHSGTDIRLIPIGYESILLIKNNNNTLSDLSVDQLRGVFSGRINEWNELGITGIEDIIAYNHEESCYIRIAFEKCIMPDLPLIKETRLLLTDGWEYISTPIDYINSNNAIGYTTGFFYTTNKIGTDISYITIDGIEPSSTNIRNGSYPLFIPLYIATKNDNNNPNVTLLIQWITESQGQEIVDISGFTSIFSYEQ